MDLQLVLSAADDYARAAAKAHAESLYGTSKSYTAECFRDENEARSKLHDLLAAAPAQIEQQAPHKWQPIGTAPADGRTILLGHFNSHGNWRTIRGQWFTKEHIEDNWEDGDLFEAGWYETSVEADDAPSCWPTKPTHWQPLPPAPTQESGARLAAEAAGRAVHQVAGAEDQAIYDSIAANYHQPAKTTSTSAQAASRLADEAKGGSDANH